jgi:riboflavin transporter FmnP
LKIPTKTLAGTITLAALVVVFDYTLRYSNLKIPFPWDPNLKFDFTGIPIVLSFLLFGLISGTLTSAVASIAILARSGNAISSSMKGIAEFSTILGMAIGSTIISRFRPAVLYTTGITARVLIMIAANLILVYSGLLFPQTTGILLVTVILAFNIAQGSISIITGYTLYEAIKRRVPTLIHKSEKQSPTASR